MTETAILAASGLLLFAYLVDIVGRRFRLPSVVLLIATGIALRHAMDPAGFNLKWVDPIVPILGTLGLILIVLEGALDLEISRDRARLIAASSASALLGFGIALAGIAVFCAWSLGMSTAAAVLAAIPFAVISSAVAIPSSAGLADRVREFVTYESSLSDILGVLVFYSWLGANGSVPDFAADLFGSGALSLVVALVVAPVVFYVVNRIEGHVRFLPLLAAIVFLYAGGKVLHLSPLVLVLVCGLVLNNPQLIRWHAWLRSIHSDDYGQTLKEFKGLVAELTFATKSFFFLMLGYWTDVRLMGGVSAWMTAIAVIAVIYASRFVVLGSLRREVATLLWIAPRGLITVLLFLSATHTGTVDAFPFGAVMLIVLVTSTTTALAHRHAPAAEAAAPPAEETLPNPSDRVVAAGSPAASE
jgi:potassium/hydrogen antiporter